MSSSSTSSELDPDLLSYHCEKLLDKAREIKDQAKLKGITMEEVLIKQRVEQVEKRKKIAKEREEQDKNKGEREVRGRPSLCT